MINPFKSVYDQVNEGNNQDKMACLPNFPRMVDIELTNTCNLKCRMCPTGMDTSTRRKGFMGWETFSKLAIECAKHYTPVRLIRWGEPTLHPDCLKYVRFLKQYGLKVHMNTNGSMMDYDLVDDLIASKLDSIKFSFQGVNSEEYSAWRQGSDYNLLCGWIKHLWVRRGEERK